MDEGHDEWGTVYNSTLARVRASPDKTKLLIEFKQQNGMDDHTYMVKTILDAFLRAGIATMNVDHVRWAGKQRSLQLDYGNVRVDFNVVFEGTEILLEVKTHDTVLADRTREQLATLTRYRKHIGLVVPEEMTKKADYMVKLNRLFPDVRIVAYEELVENPEEELERIAGRKA